MRPRSFCSGLWLRCACVGLLAVTLAGPIARADRLYQRGVEAPLEGRTLEVDDSGVLFRASRGEAGNDVLVTWDRVRFLETDREGFAEAFSQMQEVSESLWRARTRVERQDYAAAESILDPLFTRMMNRTDATALVVAEGLLRCRLARGARAAAVIPWLEMHRLLGSGLKRTAYLQMPPIVDPQSGVCPQLPPVWTRTPGVEQLAADLSHYVPDAPATERLAALYSRAAHLALGRRVQDPALFYRADNSEDPASVMITAMVAAIENVQPVPFDIDRTFSRLYREESLLSPWGWYMRGLARVASRDLDMQRDGLVDLLSLPARYREEHSYLAGFAIDAAARALESMGRTDAASSLRSELRLDYPTHPLNDAPAATRIAATEKTP